MINMNHDMQVFSLETTDATPVVLASYPLGSRASGLVRVRVFARDEGSSNDAKAWESSVSFRSDDDGTIHINGNVINLLAQGTLGAATWAVSGGINGGYLEMTVAGQAGRNIAWGANWMIDWLEVT